MNLGLSRSIHRFRARWTGGLCNYAIARYFNKTIFFHGIDYIVLTGLDCIGAHWPPTRTAPNYSVNSIALPTRLICYLGIVDELTEAGVPSLQCVNLLFNLSQFLIT